MPHAVTHIRALLATFLVLCSLAHAARAEPAVFEFSPPVRRGLPSPFAREIFAEVVTPAGESVVLPAYFTRRNRWAVRARATEPGDYQLARVFERIDGTDREFSVNHRTPPVRTIDHATSLRAVIRDPADSSRLAYADGGTYTPIGANLAWAAGERVTWHEQALRQFAAQGLNWTRIWMCHWGATNLDWLPEDMGRSPPPGHIDADIARNWDRILAAAEANDVHVQVVLQHHGQYSSTVNPNWALNPWNAANRDGFLNTPGEFFTSPRARQLTKHKYRYIVARWTHSPAVLAWELFNEVHWTNAYRHDGNEAAVAAWHTEMAEYIRSIDPYDHLVTTSLDDLESPIYAAMDYYQPHLYAINMLSSVRAFEKPVERLGRPVFYGEIGDDKMPLSLAEKSAGIQLAAQVWASLMGPSPIPGQSWLGDAFLRTDRLEELGAIARFLRETDLGARSGLVPFSPAVESDDVMPLTLEPGYDWSTHRAESVTVSLDGSDDPTLADVPGILVGNPESAAEGYPTAVTIQLDLPRATTVEFTFPDAGARGAAVEILVGDTIVGSHTWPRLPGAPAAGPQPAGTPARPASIEFQLESGNQRIEVRNTGGEDWVALGRIALDLPTPVITSAGKRGGDFIALWAWNKRGVHALTAAPAARAILLLQDVPSGRWRITWWDTGRGTPEKPAHVEHPGGTLRLPTPPIARHAAVVLSREI